MPPSITGFVAQRLNDPGVILADVARATGIPERTLRHLRDVSPGNAWASRVELIARHFGFQLVPVPLVRRRARRARVTPPAAAAVEA